MLAEYLLKWSQGMEEARNIVLEVTTSLTAYMNFPTFSLSTVFWVMLCSYLILHIQTQIVPLVSVVRMKMYWQLMRLVEECVLANLFPKTLSWILFSISL